MSITCMFYCFCAMISTTLWEVTSAKCIPIILHLSIALSSSPPFDILTLINTIYCRVWHTRMVKQVYPVSWHCGMLRMFTKFKIRNFRTSIRMVDWICPSSDGPKVPDLVPGPMLTAHTMYSIEVFSYLNYLCLEGRFSLVWLVYIITSPTQFNHVSRTIMWFRYKEG